MTLKKYQFGKSVVEAIRFDGGEEQARDIIDWLYDETETGIGNWVGTMPGWTNPDGTKTEDIPERILIMTPEMSVTANPGHWIVLTEAQQFFVYTDEAFKARFEEVVPSE